MQTAWQLSGFSSMSVVQMLPSSQPEGQTPGCPRGMAVSQVSPSSSVPLPHISGSAQPSSILPSQSLSLPSSQVSAGGAPQVPQAFKVVPVSTQRPMVQAWQSGQSASDEQPSVTGVLPPLFPPQAGSASRTKRDMTRNENCPSFTTETSKTLNYRIAT